VHLPDEAARTSAGEARTRSRSLRATLVEL